MPWWTPGLPERHCQVAGESQGHPSVYAYLDATYLHGRQGKAQRVTPRAAVVAIGVNGDKGQTRAGGVPDHQ